jgi:hypothetical protein
VRWWRCLGRTAAWAGTRSCSGGWSAQAAHGALAGWLPCCTAALPLQQPHGSLVPLYPQHSPNPASLLVRSPLFAHAASSALTRVSFHLTSRHRDCVSDEHYLPSLLAMHGMDNEVGGAGRMEQCGERSQVGLGTCCHFPLLCSPWPLPDAALMAPLTWSAIAMHAGQPQHKSQGCRHRVRPNRTLRRRTSEPGFLAPCHAASADHVRRFWRHLPGLGGCKGHQRCGPSAHLRRQARFGRWAGWPKMGSSRFRACWSVLEMFPHTGCPSA